MLIHRIFLMLFALMTCGAAIAAGETDLQISTGKKGAAVTIDKVLNDGEVLLSVFDAAKEPQFGLGAADFTVKQSGRTAKIISVKPVSERQDIPRHFVLVLDNSSSMKQRDAVKPLLDGVSELLKIVRPIDDVQIVFFDDIKTVAIGGRDLHVRTFKSSNPVELRDYTTRTYRDGMTSNTVLYEGMLAGLELIRSMPANDPRFMVVFSDGEDINSAFKKEEVLKAAQGVERFNAYTIDYMPGADKNKLLVDFAVNNNGQAWKADSETNLVPIFQSVASKMNYYYVLSYLFPPTGKIAVSPELLTVDEIIAAATERKLDITALTLRPTVDSVYGITSWKAYASNSRGTVAELGGEGTPSAEVKLPLPTADLQSLANGGDLTVSFELQDKNGQELALTAAPVKFKVSQTRAGLTIAPASVTIEEIKTIDSSPMLGQIYFDKGASEIPARYQRFGAAAETAGFDEQKFRDTLDKYYQLLNIVGKRLTDNPAATITLVGCNDNLGAEKGKKKLSIERAGAVKSYLESTWKIAPERITIEARNLPQLPSTSRSKEGQAENRRVEIRSADPAILAPIRSTYLTTRIDSPALMLNSEIVSPYGIASWKITAANHNGNLADFAGTATPAKEINIPLLGSVDLRTLANGGDIVVKMELQDRKGQNITLKPTAVKVNFIETSKLQALKQDQRMQEKYALILFDFDKDTIGGANQEIINKIVERIKALPQATVEIVGHTDNIGKEAYNTKLSERRALAVYNQLLAAYGENSADRIRYAGVGPNSPLYENILPESRSFNRTVTITLEYLSAE